MFGLFKKQTREDPQFGLLVRKRVAWIGTLRSGEAWTGTLRTPLFPEIDLAIIIEAQDENEFAVFRRHLEQVTVHCESIRSEIASAALETYRMYQDAEKDRETYEDISSRNGIWPLVKPLKWYFSLGEKEYKSRVVIDFGWPNDHYLVAYLADTELYLLNAEG